MKRNKGENLVRQRYTLEEIHQYQADLEKAEKIIAVDGLPDLQTYKHYETQVHVMREVLLRMHESVAKHGPWRPSLLRAWLTAREIRKMSKTFGKTSTIKVGKGIDHV